MQLGFNHLSDHKFWHKVQDCVFPMCTCVKKYPYLEFFWSVFSRNRTEYGEIRSSIFSVNAGKYRPQNLRIWTSFTQCLVSGYWNNNLFPPYSQIIIIQGKPSFKRYIKLVKTSQNRVIQQYGKFRCSVTANSILKQVIQD